MLPAHFVDQHHGRHRKEKKPHITRDSQPICHRIGHRVKVLLDVINRQADDVHEAHDKEAEHYGEDMYTAYFLLFHLLRSSYCWRQSTTEWGAMSTGSFPLFTSACDAGASMRSSAGSVCSS